MNVSNLDLDYLRPPRKVFDIIHTGDYILTTEGKKYTRRIFHDVHYTTYELEKLEEFQRLINKENLILPADWTYVDIMKYAYSGRLDLKRSINNLKIHLEWRESIAQREMSQNSINMLKEGVIVISGRDKQYRPIITINVDRITNVNGKTSEDFMMALCYALSVAREFYFVPGKVENWIIILDATGLGLLSFPFKIVKKMIEVTAINFTACLEKLYIMNPSKMLLGSWYLIHNLIDPKTSAKISMLKKNQYPELLIKIPSNQLEEKYGGTLVLPEVCWPPINTLALTPYSQSKRPTEDLGSNPNVDHSDIENTKNATGEDWTSADNVEAKRNRNRERIRSSVDWSAHGKERSVRNSKTKKETATSISFPKQVSAEEFLSYDSKSPDGGDRTGRFGETPNFKKSQEQAKKIREDSSGSSESLEEEDYVTKDSKKPHVVKYQSLRKLTVRLSTVKEETFEEGLTSLVMFQDPFHHSKSFTSPNKTRKSNQGLLSFTLLKNKTGTGFFEGGGGERSPTNSRQRMLFSRDRTESMDGTETENTKTLFKPEIVIEDKLEQSFEGEFEVIPDPRRQFQEIPQLNQHQLKMESRGIDSFCCKWNNSPRGKKIKHSESCNIF